MTEEQFKKAQELRKRIADLREFLFVIAPEKINDPLGVGTKKIEFIITKIKSITLWGERNFGCGKHTQIINIPQEMIEGISDLVLDEMKKLEQELESV